MTQVETENALSRIFDTFKEYQKQDNISETDMLGLINKTYLLAEKTGKEFGNGKELSIEDYEDFSDMTMDMANMIVVSLLRAYAFDITDAPYHIAEEKLKKLKKHFSRTLIHKGVISQDTFSLLFLAAHWTPLTKATEMRTMVLEQRKNAKNNN